MNLAERDLNSVWHPYTQMKTVRNIAITRAKGAILYEENGKEIIDAISSWWTILHGHGEQKILDAVNDQLAKLDHVIFAGFTHSPAIELAEELKSILPGKMEKIFYSDNGSTAVEVGIKMALQYFYNQGEEKTKVIAFENSYHGDTFGSMSVSARSKWTDPFREKLFDVDFIPVPVIGQEEEAFRSLKATIEKNNGKTAAFIFEPLILGSGGMMMYEAEVLENFIRYCKEKNILCIADEVMTGFYRTGKPFACDHLSAHYPDIICLSKGITGGILPLGVTACTEIMYQAFWSEDKGKSFFHGHSFTGNPITCAASLANISILKSKECAESVQRIQSRHLHFRDECLTKLNIQHAEVTGTILCIEFPTGEGYSYFSSLRDKLYNFFLEQGVLLRPLGNRVYILPPYGITDEQLERVYSVIRMAIGKFCNHLQIQ